MPTTSIPVAIQRWVLAFTRYIIITVIAAAVAAATSVAFAGVCFVVVVDLVRGQVFLIWAMTILMVAFAGVSMSCSELKFKYYYYAVLQFYFSAALF